MPEEEKKELENYLSIMIDLTEKEGSLIKSFEQRFKTIYEHHKRTGEILQIARGLLLKFDLRKKEEMKEKAMALKKYILEKFEPLVTEEEQILEKSKKLAYQEAGYVKREQIIFAHDYVQLKRDLAEKGIKGSDAEKALRKEIEELAESIKKEKKRMTVNEYLIDLVEKSAVIITEMKDVVVDELSLLDNFIFKEKYIRSRQEFKDNIYKLGKLVKRLINLLRKEKEIVIGPFNKFLKEKRSIDKELKESLKERGKITVGMIEDDLRRLTIKPKEVSYYINRLKDNYEYLKPEAKDYIKRYVNRLRRAAEWRRDKEEATIDELTRLKTEKAFILNVEEKEIPRAQRANGTFSIAMIDIDYFKRFNDTYGHDVGDRVLYFLAWVIQKTVRATDVPYRLHGEEFLVLFIDTNKQKAKEAAEKLRKAMEEESVSFMKKVHEFRPVAFYKRKKNITISIGIATYPEDGTGRMALYNKADAALYESKRKGRNSVTAAGEYGPRKITTVFRRLVKK